jgi:hypothetical protein
MRRVGQGALLLYVLFTYVPQFVFHSINAESLAERFRLGANAQELALFIPAFLMLVLVLNALIPRVDLGGERLLRLIAAMFESSLNTFVGVAMLGLAVNFYLTEGISFRHSGERVSDAGLAVQLVLLCKPYVCAWLVYHYIQTIRGLDRHSTRVRWQALLFLVSLVVSLTGSLDMLPIVWFLLFVVCGRKRLRALFVVIGRPRPLIVRILLVMVGVPLGAALALLIVYIGLANKLGMEGTSALVERVGIANIAEQVMVRVSSSYAATISFAENNLFNHSIYYSAMDVPLDNVPYRLSLLFGAPLPRPDITQISRLNYLNYEYDTHLDHAGASPGLVASAFYAAPFPLGYVLMALYTVMVIRIVNLPFRSMQERLRVAVAALVASFIYPLFESPVDYLVFVDPAFLQLLILAAFAAATAQTDARAALPVFAPAPSGVSGP